MKQKGTTAKCKESPEGDNVTEGAISGPDGIGECGYEWRWTSRGGVQLRLHLAGWGCHGLEEAIMGGSQSSPHEVRQLWRREIDVIPKKIKKLFSPLPWWGGDITGEGYHIGMETSLHQKVSAVGFLQHHLEDEECSLHSILTEFCNPLPGGFQQPRWQLLVRVRTVG